MDLIPENEMIIEKNMVITLHPKLSLPDRAGSLTGDTLLFEADDTKAISDII